MSNKTIALIVANARNRERKRIIEIIEALDISEFIKDDIIHAIAEEETND